MFERVLNPVTIGQGYPDGVPFLGPHRQADHRLNAIAQLIVADEAVVRFRDLQRGRIRAVRTTGAGVVHGHPNQAALITGVARLVGLARQHLPFGVLARRQLKAIAGTFVPGGPAIGGVRPGSARLQATDRDGTVDGHAIALCAGVVRQRQRRCIRSHCVYGQFERATDRRFVPCHISGHGGEVVATFRQGRCFETPVPPTIRHRCTDRITIQEHCHRTARFGSTAQDRRGLIGARSGR